MYQDDVQDLQGQYREDTKSGLIPALLGDGSRNWKDLNTPGKVIVRIILSNGRFSTPRSVLGPSGVVINLKDGEPVWLERFKGQLRVKEPNASMKAASGIDPVVAQQQLMSPSKRQNDILTLKVVATEPASGAVVIKSWNPIIDGVFTPFSGLITADLCAAYAPAAGQTLYIVIALLADLSTYEVMASTAQSVGDFISSRAAVQECLDAITVGSIPVMAIPLSDAQTTIPQSNIDPPYGIPLQQLINISDSSSSGGGEAPANAKYLIQQTDAQLPNAQIMALLATGLVKNTTTTGAQSIAAASDVASTIGSDTQGKVYATPAASTDVPSLRALAQSDLPVMTGDSGSGGVKGAVPAPAAGDASKFLRGNATWQAARIQYRSAQDFYVRTDGNDNNDGSANDSGHAWATIQHAVDAISAMDNGGYDQTIHVADGTYTASGIILRGIIGAGYIIITGNASTPANVDIVSNSGNAFTFYQPSGGYVLQNFACQAAAGSTNLAVTAPGCSINFSNLVFKSGSTDIHMLAQNGGLIYCSGNYLIENSAHIHLYSALGGVIQIPNVTVTVTGTPAFDWYFAWSDSVSVLQSFGCTFGTCTGQRYRASMNAIIQTYGGGANYFPGNVAGATDTGGQYA